jgi:hypothetical protein
MGEGEVSAWATAEPLAPVLYGHPDLAETDLQPRGGATIGAAPRDPSRSPQNLQHIQRDVRTDR